MYFRVILSQDSTIDSRHHWRRVMQGHAGANMTPVVASNRVGRELPSSEKNSAQVPNSAITFYGTSFIADQTGAVVKEADDHSEDVLVASFDLTSIRAQRSAWGMFRDRRPELYTPILTKDGHNRFYGV